MNSYQTPDDIIPKLILSGKAVHSKIDALMELSAEFALKARFDDPARIKGLIRELKARAEAMTIQGGVNMPYADVCDILPSHNGRIASVVWHTTISWWSWRADWRLRLTISWKS
jgi:Zn-dependent M16 (insulinase) family peptidase